MSKENKENNEIAWTYRRVSVKCGHCNKNVNTLNAIRYSDKFVFACNNCTKTIIENNGV